MRTDNEERVPTIWRIQEPPRSVERNRDYSSCQGYGTIVTVLDHLDRPSARVAHAFEKLMRHLSRAEPGDYLLWAGGDPMSLLLAGMALARLELTDQITWLRWDRRTAPDGARTPFGYYTPIQVGIPPDLYYHGEQEELGP